jgi:hypothetical protein
MSSIHLATDGQVNDRVIRFYSEGYEDVLQQLQ